MPEELAVRIEDLSITYKINVDTKKTLKNAVMRASRGEKVRMRTVEAVKHMNLEIPHGSVLGIVGANGAGKSTLIKIISGVVQPDEGRMTLDGQDVSFRSPSAANDAGIVCIFQELSLMPRASVLDNIALGREITRNGLVDRKATRQWVLDVMARHDPRLHAGA